MSYNTKEKYGFFIKAIAGIFLIFFIPVKLHMNMQAVGIGYLAIGIIGLGISGWYYWRSRE